MCVDLSAPVECAQIGAALPSRTQREGQGIGGQLGEVRACGVAWRRGPVEHLQRLVQIQPDLFDPGDEGVALVLAELRSGARPQIGQHSVETDRGPGRPATVDRMGDIVRIVGSADVEGGAGATTERARAERLDADDVLAPLRERFVVPSASESDLIYLDGNSLGMLPRSSVRRLLAVVEQEWGGSSSGPGRPGSTCRRRSATRSVRHCSGAGPGQVTIADSTSVNLFKLAWAAVDAQPGRSRILTDAGNFPTDRYVLEGIAARAAWTSISSAADADTLMDAIDDDLALVSLSHVDYRSAAIADVAGLTAAAHENGALVLWDRCPPPPAPPGRPGRVGCRPRGRLYVQVSQCGPGCSRVPLRAVGFAGAATAADLGLVRAAGAVRDGTGVRPGARRRAVPGRDAAIPGVALVDEGVALLAAAGIDRVRAKSVALTALLVELFDAWLAQLGFTLASPRDPVRRGSHVSLAHADGYRISRALIERGHVIPDFREPDLIRCGLAPLTTRFVDVWDAMDRLRSLVESGAHLAYRAERGVVT